MFNFPDLPINVVKPKEPVEAKIVESKICTLESSPNFIRHITIDVSGTPLVGQFKAGQSIGIIAPGVDKDGKPHKVRLYSVSSPSNGENGNPNLVSTTVKRVLDEDWETQELFTGVCSNYISSRKAGDTILIAGPSGKRFILPDNKLDCNYVFFATGTGIAPFRGMLIDLFESGFKGHVALLFGAAYRTDLLYYKWLSDLEKQYPNFHYKIAVSREGRRADGTKTYVQHLILDYKEELSPIFAQENTLMYICGLEGMEAGIYSNLASLGFYSYMKAGRNIAEKPATEWTWEDYKNNVKPSDRTMVEVY